MKKSFEANNHLSEGLSINTTYQCSPSFFFNVFLFLQFHFLFSEIFFNFAWIMKVTYNFEELREMTLSPPFELELSSLNVRSRTLNVCNRTLSIDYGSFMDGLLWSCRPKVISLSTGLEFQEKYIMVWLFFYNILDCLYQINLYLTS